MSARHRVAVVGCGQMANVWVKDALERDGVEVVALVDVRADVAEAMRERHGLTCPVFTDLPRALATSGATLVFDVTPPDAHAATALTALAHGCHVFGEKPLAHTLSAAHEIVRAAREAGRVHAVMQNRRYLPGVHALRDLVRGGALGEASLLCADFFVAPHFGGFRDAMRHPLLLDMAIHAFDTARFVSGANAVAVTAHAWNPAGSWYAGAASAVCLFEMSDGSVFSYRGSWCAEGLPTSWDGAWRAVGRLGSAVWDGHGDVTAEVLADPEQEGFTRTHRPVEASSPYAGRDGHAGCLDDLFLALDTGTEPPTAAHDNLRSLEMVLGAVESADTGRRVPLGGGSA